jgi:hypothetical protein
MTKINIRIPEPKTEYDVSNQKQINRALTIMKDQLNSTFLDEVKSLLIAEDASSTATVEVTLTNASGTAFVVDKEVSLSSKAKEQVLSEPLIMEESEILKVNATSGAADVIASILEINRD